jgi:hypothetical protein
MKKVEGNLYRSGLIKAPELAPGMFTPRVWLMSSCGALPGLLIPASIRLM